MSGRRLYLFDIDGTLIATGGAGGAAMRQAFKALWRDSDGFKGIEFSGRTDRALLHQALIASKLDSDFESKLSRFKRAYYRRLPDSLRAHEGEIMPGVHEVLDELAADDEAILALGTGNFRTSAFVKLAFYGIDHYFETGGFGDKTEDRAQLIGDGIRAAQRKYGRHDAVYVIGDTIHDITAAKANDAIAIGVTTGSSDEAALAAAGADVVLPDLTKAWKALGIPGHVGRFELTAPAVLG